MALSIKNINKIYWNADSLELAIEYYHKAASLFKKQKCMIIYLNASVPWDKLILH
ncbi:MAG: hypothetical protein Kow0068_16870 [Marinilabiliales bacterium]